MTFSATLDKTLRLYRANFAQLLAVAAVAGVAQLPLMLMLERKPPPGVPPASFWGNFGLALLIAPLVAVLVSAALKRIVIGIYQGERVGFGQAYRAVLSRIPTLLVTAILTMVAVAGGVLLLVFPGIYIALGFSMAVMVVMAEGAPALQALKRSWRLAKGLRWRLFALLFVWGLLNVVLSYAVGGLLQLFGVAPGGAVKALSNQLVAVLVTPCYALSLAIVYFTAREEKEGHDLSLAAQQLPGATAPAVGAPAV
jgi:hypothetical protein